MCDNCMHKPVCSKYRATGGVKTCEHHKEERRGEWAHLGGDEWCCTACGEVITTEGSWEKPKKKFCYECGADMRGAADGKE